MAIKKGMTTIFFVAVFGSEIRDPGWVKIRIRDPGSGIWDVNIPDPPHCCRAVPREATEDGHAGHPSSDECRGDCQTNSGLDGG